MKTTASRATILEAADLLACLASQPRWSHFIDDAPGGWSAAARQLATAARDQAISEDDTMGWDEDYAEAEAILRDLLAKKGRR